MQKFKVRFFLRSAANKEGKHTVMVRIHLNGDRKFLTSTDIVVDKNDWDNILERVNLNSVEGRMINNRLETLESEINFIFHRNEYNPNLSLDLIKSEYIGTLASESPEESFVKFFEDYVERRKEESESKTSRDCFYKYSTTLRNFKDYLKNDYKRSDVKFNELDYNFIIGFEHYMRKTTGNYCSNNTILKKLRYLKTVVIDARKCGLINRDPFAGIKILYSRVDRGFLEDSEIQCLINKEFNCERLEHVRDLFLFAVFTGLAYIDVKRLTKDNIVTLNGRRWIIKSREKTDVTSHIPLLPMAANIIKKYEKQCKDSQYLLPMLSNQKMNMYLKEVAFYCGIEKRLSYHLARHTFATMTLSKGVPIESVSKMLGHTSIRTTQIYARITAKKLEQDMAAFASKIENFGTFTTPAKVISSPHLDAIKNDVAVAIQQRKRGRPRKNK